MSEAMAAVVSDRKWKAVYTIVDRQDQSEKKWWVRIGTAFINRDQSMNVHLDAVPTNGSLHIRDYEPYQNGHSEGRGEANNAKRSERTQGGGR